MHGSPLSYDVTLFITQLMVAFAIVVLAVAAKTTRRRLEQRLRTLEVHALRMTQGGDAAAYRDPPREQ